MLFLLQLAPVSPIGPHHARKKQDKYRCSSLFLSQHLGVRKYKSPSYEDLCYSPLFFLLCCVDLKRACFFYDVISGYVIYDVASMDFGNITVMCSNEQHTYRAFARQKEGYLLPMQQHSNILCLRVCILIMLQT